MLRIIIVLLVIIVIAIQFIRPPLDNPPVTGDLQAPPEVKQILVRACYDCHSNQTQLAWFDQVAPAYWTVVRDVRAGRAVLNFSNWDSLSAFNQTFKLYECVMMVEQHAMPLSSYSTFHHGGIITADDIEVLKKYTLTLAYKPTPDPAREQAVEAQFTQWAAANDGNSEARIAAVKDEVNGIGYKDLSDWSNWELVSSTERFDIGTLMMIRGNAIAVKAIREGHTRPYPDGAIFCKTAYLQNPDSNGETRPGIFLQTEFMIKDSKKYADSYGWGWARWLNGMALQPYAKEASFVTECMRCHKPFVKSDYTYTMPLVDTIRLYDHGTAVADSLGGRPLTGRLITNFVNRNEKTTSSLIGNDVATASARSGKEYAAGSVITLVNWAQKADEHYFGAWMPGELRSVEVLKFGADGKPSYTLYAGPGLEKKIADSGTVAQRVQYITARKAEVAPVGAIDVATAP